MLGARLRFTRLCCVASETLFGMVRKNVMIMGLLCISKPLVVPVESAERRLDYGASDRHARHAVAHSYPGRQLQGAPSSYA